MAKIDLPQLPKSVKHPKLVLKRGVAGRNSALAQWCQETLEYGLVSGYGPWISLLDCLMKRASRYELGTSLTHIRLSGKQGFKSTKNEIAIEIIELSYNFSNRVA